LDIAAMSMSLNQLQLKEQDSISVMKMAMDSAQGQEEALDKLLEASTKALDQSVQTNLGSNIDFLPVGEAGGGFLWFAGLFKVNALLEVLKNVFGKLPGRKTGKLL